VLLTGKDITYARNLEGVIEQQLPWLHHFQPVPASLRDDEGMPGIDVQARLLDIGPFRRRRTGAVP